MSEISCDVIVIGAGPAGEVAAGRLADGGLEVVVVENHLVAGECSYYACMPSKALLRPGDLIDEARRIVRTARSRYDGRLRPELNSGPGGNPFNELECGKFYARAMSSWSLLIASQGLVLDGPAGLIGFKPRWQPEDHRSFYTAAEGWGLFVQKREAESQTSRIDVRHGRLRVRELVVQAPPGAGEMRVDVRAGGRRVRVAASQQGDEVRIRCSDWVAITEGQEIEIRLTW